ncbi:hypothetical protein M0802_004682 [Mischocyttarus mexicanus]|nr:hypothetical protein M0802_004682 [Mischocyttarus mexicanus]
MFTKGYPSSSSYLPRLLVPDSSAKQNDGKRCIDEVLGGQPESALSTGLELCGRRYVLGPSSHERVEEERASK